MKKSKKYKRGNVSDFFYRIGVIIVCGIIFYFWNIGMLVVFIAQLLVYLFNGMVDEKLKAFSNVWFLHIVSFFRYALFLSDDLPFPFSEIKTKEKE